MDAEQIPKAHDASCYVIGCLVKFPECAADVFTRLKATDFFDEEHQKIFAAATKQFAEAGEVDPMLLAKHTGQPQLLVELALNPDNAPATKAHIPIEAEKIIEARRKRERYDELHTLAEHSLNGYSSEQIDRRLEVARSDWKRERESDADPWRFSFRDMRTAYPKLNPVVVEGIAREGETVNMIAPSKFGKSWKWHYILLCIITGRYIFGKFATTAGKVIAIDNELHRPTVRHRIDEVAAAMGLRPEEYQDDLEVWPVRGLGWTIGDVHDRILDHVEPGTVRAIGYDALYRFLPDGVSENDNGAVKEIYNRLDAIGEFTKAANFVVHHSSKGSQSDKRVTDVGAGAGSQSRAADTHLILREHEEPGIAVMEAAVRSFAPVEPMALRWSFPLWLPADDVDTSLLKGRLKPNEERQNEKDREGVNKIVDVLRKWKEADGQATPRALREKTGIGQARQQRLLDSMSADGLLVSKPLTVRGNPTREYSLPEDDK